MKNLLVVLVLVSLISGAVGGRALAADPQTQYAQAVKAYVDAATDELRAIRGSVDAQVAAIKGENEKARFDVVFAKLDACDKLLVDLKKSGPRDFDHIKVKYEQARGEAVKALDAVAKG
jgi:hypothetical protein